MKKPTDSKHSTPKAKTINRSKWCKAAWYLRGTGGKIESATVPREWVSRTQRLIRWPTSKINFRKAIEECLPSKPEWQKYSLVYATNSVSTLAEANELNTEEQGSDTDVPEERSLDMGRGCRPRKKPRTLELDVEEKLDKNDEKNVDERARVSGEAGPSTSISQPESLNESIVESLHSGVSSGESDTCQKSESSSEDEVQEPEPRKKSVPPSETKLLVKIGAELKPQCDKIIARLDQLEKKIERGIKGQLLA